MSKKSEYYNQCELRKENYVDVSWIPSKFAFVGNILKVKYDEIWEDGWKVTRVYSKKKGETVLDDEMLYKRNRKVSDI